MRSTPLLILLICACDSKQFEDQAGPSGFDVPNNDQDQDGVPDSEDCNDTDASISIASEEVCDGLDNDCDGEIDNGLEFALYYPDADNDGYGADANPTEACSIPEGHVFAGGDCDDNNVHVFPTANETCNGVDDNCDGLTDLEDPNVTDALHYYEDLDADGYGGFAFMTVSCVPVLGGVANQDDCDDGNPNVNPSAIEICDGHDNDCDETTHANGVSIEDENGITSNTSLMIGTPASPVRYQASENQTLHLCEDALSFQIDGAHSVHLKGYDGAQIELDSQPLFTANQNQVNISMDGLTIDGASGLVNCTDCSISLTEINVTGSVQEPNGTQSLIELTNGNLHIEDSIFQDNRVPTMMALSNVETSVSTSRFQGNIHTGSGLEFIGGESRLELVDLFDNQAPTGAVSINSSHTMSVVNVQFISPDPGIDDNTNGLATLDGLYNPPGSLEFHCDNGSCGVSSDDMLAYPASQIYTSPVGDFRGNVYTFSENQVIEHFSTYVENMSDDCQFGFYVLKENNGWDMVYGSTRLIQSGYTGWVESDFVGTHVLSGEVYALASGWDCNLMFGAQNLPAQTQVGNAFWSGEVVRSTNYNGFSLPDVLTTAQAFAYTQRLSTRRFIP